jgi:late competence protein required for DNA uptake (superfamily II DNA/RNA helicase)
MMISSSSQSIKALRPLKGRMIVDEDFGISSNDDTIQSENKLIHEHDFITARIKETNSFLIHCITCGICYCDLCGKALGDKVTNNHECYNIYQRNNSSGCHSSHSVLGVAGLQS